jgi:hypothetical protein
MVQVPFSGHFSMAGKTNHKGGPGERGGVCTTETQRSQRKMGGEERREEKNRAG